MNNRAYLISIHKKGCAKQDPAARMPSTWLVSQFVHAFVFWKNVVKKGKPPKAAFSNQKSGANWNRNYAFCRCKNFFSECRVLDCGLNPAPPMTKYEKKYSTAIWEGSISAGPVREHCVWMVFQGCLVWTITARQTFTIPPSRLGICQKIYTTQFSGERILHTENM